MSFMTNKRAPTSSIDNLPVHFLQPEVGEEDVWYAVCYRDATNEDHLGWACFTNPAEAEECVQGVYFVRVPAAWFQDQATEKIKKEGEDAWRRFDGGWCYSSEVKATVGFFKRWIVEHSEQQVQQAKEGIPVATELDSEDRMNRLLEQCGMHDQLGTKN